MMADSQVDYDLLGPIRWRRWRVSGGQSRIMNSRAVVALDDLRHDGEAEGAALKHGGSAHFH